MTDPRTPPALSNATPRPTCGGCGRRDADPGHREECEIYGYVPPAAPPVAEGPAATPRQSCTCPTSSWIGSEPNDSTCKLSEEEHAAAAEPFTPNAVEARAAAQRCDVTQTLRYAIGKCSCPTYDGNLGPCATWEEGANRRCVYCDHDKDCHLGVAADLQRQLDEARRERDAFKQAIGVPEGTPQDIISAAVEFCDGSEEHARVLRHVIEQGKRVESAEAANQELCTRIASRIVELRKAQAKFDSRSLPHKAVACGRAAEELGALLGPQYGEQK
jgi:hypothetical protein